MGTVLHLAMPHWLAALAARRTASFELGLTVDVPQSGLDISVTTPPVAFMTCSNEFMKQSFSRITF
jgi:hypothetical protein